MSKIRSSGGFSIGQNFKYKGKLYRIISFLDKTTVRGMSISNVDDNIGVDAKLTKITRC
jgi:hypothetical protein